MITHLSHATIFVLDYDQALDFYTNRLGFEVRADFPMEGGFRWLTVGPQNQPELELVLYKAMVFGKFDAEAVGHLRALLERGLMGGGVFDTDDCRATYEELKSRGVEFSSPPTENPYGVEAIFSDGCGNWFSLTQHTQPQE